MFVCTNCSQSTLKWTWKCPNCGTWNTLEEKTEGKKEQKHTGKKRETSALLKNVSLEIQRMQSTSKELDGVLGGGIVPGSLILLSGEPGIGKSTLALQMSEWYAEKWSHILYISGEEHIWQISARAERLWVSHENIAILTGVLFEDIVATINESKSNIIIIDSLSVISSELIEWSPGSISQIRIMTEILMAIAKKQEKSILLIWHVTKDGTISGPKSLEHLVDVVLFLEGVRTENYRILRSFKNRFGSAENIWLFRMDEDGLIDIPNPGVEFIDQTNEKHSGSALAFSIEGNRPILIEIEALTTYTKFGYPKRSTRWIQTTKLDLILAVMSKYTKEKLESSDVYINIGRGLTVQDTGIDLAIVAAIMSSKRSIPLGRKLYIGEVSLTGRIKPVFMMERRLLEAEKLGFLDVVIPKQYEWKIPSTLKVERMENLEDLHL